MKANGKNRSAARARRSETLAKIARILFMDDTDIVRSAVSEVLAVLGYEVVCAAEGGEVIEKYRRAREEGKPFDVVVLDLTVGQGMGGRQAIKELLTIDPAARIVVSSGFPDNPVMIDFRKYGVAAVVVKPYGSSELDSVLRRVLRQ